MGTILGQLMSKNVKSIMPTRTVYEAAKMMAEGNIGSLLVMDNERLVGMISETDVIRRCMALRINPHQIKVEAIMSTPVITIDIHEEIDAASRTMKEHRIRHLVVMEEGTLAGVISVRDLLRYYRS